MGTRRRRQSLSDRAQLEQRARARRRQQGETHEPDVGWDGRRTRRPGEGEEKVGRLGQSSRWGRKGLGSATQAETELELKGRPIATRCWRGTDRLAEQAELFEHGALGAWEGKGRRERASASGRGGCWLASPAGRVGVCVGSSLKGSARVAGQPASSSAAVGAHAHRPRARARVATTKIHFGAAPKPRPDRWAREQVLPLSPHVTPPLPASPFTAAAALLSHPVAR